MSNQAQSKTEQMAAQLKKQGLPVVVKNGKVIINQGKSKIK